MTLDSYFWAGIGVSIGLVVSHIAFRVHLKHRRRPSFLARVGLWIFDILTAPTLAGFGYAASLVIRWLASGSDQDFAFRLGATAVVTVGELYAVNAFFQTYLQHFDPRTAAL